MTHQPHNTPLRLGIVSVVWVSLFVSLAFAQVADSLPSLSPGEHELKEKETHSYRLSLSAGQFFYGLVEQKEIDVVIAVFGPGGNQLAETDSPNDRWGTEPVLLVAEEPGDYRVEVRAPTGKVAPGRYEIRVVAQREATPADKRLVSAQRLAEEARKLGAEESTAAKRAGIEKYKQAAEIFHERGEKYLEALALRAIATRYVQFSEFRNVLKYAQQGQVLAQSLGDRRLEGSLETFLGGASDFLGEVTQALAHYVRAVVLSRANGNRSTEASALNNIGKIYSDASNQQKALEYYLQALPLYQPFGNDLPQAITLNNIGIVYNKLGEPAKALDYLQQALTKFRAIGARTKNSESVTLSNMGDAYSLLNDTEKALSCYNQARTIQQQIGNKTQEAETLEGLGELYLQLNQPQKALEFHEQAVQLLRAAGNVRREAISLSNLGHVHNVLGRPDQGLDYFNQSLAILRRIGDLNNVAIALEGIARAEQQRGNLIQSRKNIEESLGLIETVRAHTRSQQLRASYLASKDKAYEFYVDLLMQLHGKNPANGHDAEALKASERGRARSLTEMLTEAHVDILQGVSADLVKKEREIRQSLNAKAQRLIQLTAQKGNQQEIETLNKEISALEDEHQQVQAAIRQTSPQYAALTQPQPLGLKEIQQQLDQNTILLEYALGEERSYVWAVTQSSLKSYVLPKRAEIQQSAEQVYGSLRARSVFKSLETPAQRSARIAEADKDFQQAANELSRMILAPVAGELGNKRLVIVADGALQYVPFAALSVPSSSVTSLPSKPLIVDHEVISLPSVSAFAVQRENLANRPLAPKTLAVIADPVFSTSDPRVKANAGDAETATRSFEHLPANTTAAPQLAIPRLPFTRSEADRILAVARAGSNLKALDFRANRATAMSGELSKYRYVHFATHGYLDTARAGLSAIVLSMFDENGKPQDGFLRTHDVYNLKLPAELVVLSACETGLGKDVRGEGLEGLTRGFMYAGARRVVVSLWNVNDKATATLMQRLYTGMLRSNKTPAAALRAAQIEMLRTPQWQSPYYWAPFVMQGEWR